RQAEEQQRAADTTVAARLPETYQWLLVPVQVDRDGRPDPRAEVTLQAIRLQGNDPLAVRAGKRLRHEELLLTGFAGTRLRMELDQIPLWRGDHVEIRQLAEDFACYVYLPRLKNAAVLVNAVRDGIALLTWESDSFAYADSFDATAERYRGLRAAQDVSISEVNPQGLLVKPEVARRQFEAEQVGPPPPVPTDGTREGTERATTTVLGGNQPAVIPKPPSIAALPRRFHGSVDLDSVRAGAEVGKIVQEVIAHLTSLPGARVRVTLEVQADVPNGVPEKVVRIVTENCRTLKFSSHGFENE
ncbi:MAG: AAA+ family ATPase, partial [Roseiflexus sp.]